MGWKEEIEGWLLVHHLLINFKKGMPKKRLDAAPLNDL